MFFYNHPGLLLKQLEFGVRGTTRYNIVRIFAIASVTWATYSRVLLNTKCEWSSRFYADSAVNPTWCLVMALPCMLCVKRTIVDTEPESLESSTLVTVNFALAISGLLAVHAVDIVVGKI